MSTILKFFEGKKTYLVSAGGILFVLAQLWASTIDTNTATVSILGFLGLSTARSGMNSILTNLLNSAIVALPKASETEKTIVELAAPVVATLEASSNTTPATK